MTERLGGTSLAEANGNGAVQVFHECSINSMISNAIHL